MSNLEARIAALEQKNSALMNQLRGSPGVSTAGGGAVNIRTLQLGFAAEITSTYSSTTGYSWKRLKLEPPSFIAPGVQLTGDKAFAIPPDVTLVSGDQVWLEPSPDAVGYIITAGASGIDGGDNNESPCGGCGWLLDLQTTVCLEIAQYPGEGNCDCMDALADDVYGTDNPDVRVGTTAVYSTDFSGWVAVKMLSTCCGCGTVTFKPNATDPTKPTLELQGFHVSCDGGAVFDLTCRIECCGIDSLGRPYASFVGYGPKTCDTGYEDEVCSNVFRFRVTCGICPPIECACTGCGVSPNPLAVWSTVTGFANAAYNGNWVWLQDETDPCLYTGSCGSGTGAVTSTIEFTPGSPDAWVMTHGGATFESTAGTFCGATSVTFTKTAGTGPASIATKALFVLAGTGTDDVCCTGLNLDDFPDSFTASVSASVCPILDGFSQTLTRTGAAYEWTWTNLAGASTNRINSASVYCNAGTIVFEVVGVCDEDAWGVSYTGTPDTHTAEPFLIIWDAGVVTSSGTHPTCCDAGASEAGMLSS